jgi:hypothetical protein
MIYNEPKIDLRKPSELLNESWAKPKLRHRAPNVLSVIGRATSLSFWVATVIQLSENPVVRSKVMSKMIKIGKVNF